LQLHLAAQVDSIRRGAVHVRLEGWGAAHACWRDVLRQGGDAPPAAALCGGTLVTVEPAEAAIEIEADAVDVDVALADAPAAHDPTASDGDCDDAADGARRRKRKARARAASAPPPPVTRVNAERFAVLPREHCARLGLREYNLAAPPPPPDAPLGGAGGAGPGSAVAHGRPRGRPAGDRGALARRARVAARSSASGLSSDGSRSPSEAESDGDDDGEGETACVQCGGSADDALLLLCDTCNGA
jgi:hypothetical protein